MKISVIIPTLNEAENIVSSILSVKNQDPTCEIIVIDGGSTDATVDMARPYASVFASQPGRAAQMNAGARRASGEVLLFLHGDSRLHPDGVAALRQVMMNPRVVGGTFTLKFDSRKFLLRLNAFLTRFTFRYFHYGDQGVIVRRSVFQQLGGFTDTPLMEDIDFLRRLRKLGKMTLIRLPVTTSARRFLAHGIVRQTLLDTILVILYLLGVSPERLAHWYQRTDLRPSKGQHQASNAAKD